MTKDGRLHNTLDTGTHLYYSRAFEYYIVYISTLLINFARYYLKSSDLLY